MKIVFFEVEKWEQEFLKKSLPRHNLVFYSKELTRAAAKKNSDAEALGVFIYSKVTKEILDLFPKLKLIVTMSTGYNHIDVEECKKRGVVVSNVPTYGDNTVAEHTFALLLSLSRKIHLSYERTQKSNFNARGLEGFDLEGKTLGVIGCGNIGTHVVRIAKGFQMKVLVHEKHKDEKKAKKLGFRNVSLKKLYKDSDIVSFHVPLVPSTKHLFNKDSLKDLKKGALLINTARGEIIDTDALLLGLRKGIIGGAGLDVLEGECFIREEKQVIDKHFPQECDLRMVLKNHVLLKQNNVLITPHNAFNSKEALERILLTTVENLAAFPKKKNAVSY